MTEEITEPIPSLPLPTDAVAAAVGTAAAESVAPLSNDAEANVAFIPNNMKDFRRLAPDVYEMMMKSIAQQVMTQMQSSQKRLKQIIKKG
jgi:hypothetical protein